MATKKRRSRPSRKSRSTRHSRRYGNAPRRLERTDAMPGRAGMYQYGPKGRNGASIWVSGPIAGTWYATVKFRSQEKDLDARSLDGALGAAKKWVDDAPELSTRDGRSGHADQHRSTARTRSSRPSRRSSHYGKSRQSRRHGDADYRDLQTKEHLANGYLIETEGRSYAQPGFARTTKYGFTTHGPGARHSSGLIFYSRAEALAAAKARLRSSRGA